MLLLCSMLTENIVSADYFHDSVSPNTTADQQFVRIGAKDILPSSDIKTSVESVTVNEVRDIIRNLK